MPTVKHCAGGRRGKGHKGEGREVEEKRERDGERERERPHLSIECEQDKRLIICFNVSAPHETTSVTTLCSYTSHLEEDTTPVVHLVSLVFTEACPLVRVKC